jgi:hypothetical protein
MHKIKAYLYDNVLTDDPNDFSARVNSERSLTVKNISDSAATRGGANISSASMEHAVNLWLKEMTYRLCDGFSINTGYFTASAHIRGVFNSPTERFNPQKHTLSFMFNQGSLLRREAQAVEVEIVGVADASLNIAQVTDVRSGSVNDLLTPNRNLRIAGSRLRIAGDNPSCGVWFVNDADGTRTQVDTGDIVTNNPSELIIVIPALAPGTYRVEVSTQYGGTTPLKEPRTAVFDRPLTVQ